MQANKTKSNILLLFALLLLVLFTGAHATIEGVYHTVRSGETLWGISNAYGVSVDRIREANRELARTNLIRPGQRIFIPSAEAVLVVEHPTPQIQQILRQGWSNRWKYIIIHHSATDIGSAALFHRAHLARGFNRGLGYHFVIANGTDNTRSGQIQTSPGLRWRRQWDGAHTRGEMNRVGIGICLVGNFDKNTPGRSQMDSLVQLTTHLAYKYDIPLENIKGHKDCVNNTTRCPGENFPWDDFRKALRERGIR